MYLNHWLSLLPNISQYHQRTQRHMLPFLTLTLSCMVSITVDRYLEAILNHLSCSTMSQLPGGEPPKCCLQFHLNVIFDSVILRYWIINSKWRREEEMHQVAQEYLWNTFILKEKKTGKKYIFQLYKMFEILLSSF